LNEVQRKAVCDTKGAVLVFAGAGSGKTRVLTYRVARLIEDENVPAWQILAITFTNKATNEMKQRLNDMLGDNEVWVSTFHALCAKILFKHAEKLGYNKNFSIYDENASQKVLSNVFSELKIEQTVRTDEGIYNRFASYKDFISEAKNKGLASDEYFHLIRGKEKEAMSICEIYDAYDKALMLNNAMDFDDLLIKTYRLLLDSPDVLNEYKRRFRYIHVDEFQDTNEVQFSLIKLLAAPDGNIFVVGDDDQSIYGWRGANVNNILGFEKVFPNAKTYKLEQNYRSTKSILDCANRLIKNNKKRSDKTLFTEKKDTSNVEYIVVREDRDEVRKVTDLIKSLKRPPNDYTNGDIAVLVRNNSLTQQFEEAFMANSIGYRVSGSFEFFKRKEVLDCLAYLRLIINPKDGEALTRIINVPRRGIGDTTVEQLREYATSQSKSLLEVISTISENPEFSTSARKKVGEFYELILRLEAGFREKNFPDFVKHMVDEIGFESHFLATNNVEDEVRWENILRLAKYVQDYYVENIDVVEFIHKMALNGNDDDDFDNEKITIATMHSVKGLEFKVVIIVACEEGILPYKRQSTNSKIDESLLEEERRVMYVAMTRAQERLYICCCSGSRWRFGKSEKCTPSRFIQEAKGEAVSAFEKKQWGDFYEPNLPRKSREWEYGERIYTKDIGEPKGIPDTRDLKPNIKFVGSNLNIPITQVYNNSPEGFVSGANVNHSRYGRGLITNVEGKWPATVVSVLFPELGVRKFNLMSAPLELCEN